MLGGSFLLSNELLHLNIFVPVQFCLEPLGCNLLLGLQLLLKLFVLELRVLLSLLQLFLLLVKELSSVFKLLDLDLQELKLDVSILDLLPEVLCLLDAAL